MEATNCVLWVAPYADASVVSTPHFNQRVSVAAGDRTLIPEHRATIVSLISVHTRDIVRGTGVTLAKRALEPAKSFRIVPPYATSDAEADAEVILAGRVAGNRTLAEPADSGARVGMDENLSIRVS
jgi:hypothetical protein